jgi:hypothetical protein
VKPPVGAPGDGGFLLDAHVHFQAVFAAVPFLDAAAANLRRGAAALGLPAATPLCLAFGDAPGQPGVEGLLAAVSGGTAAPWRRVETADPAAASVRRDGELLYLLRGQQLVTREGIEVLALACGGQVAAGRPLAETCAAARRLGAVVVVPWGFGKWTGERGARLRELLTAASPGELLLADSAARPASWPRPALLCAAERRGLGVVTGSDPLPLRRHARRAGRCGSFVAGDFDPARPAASAARLLARLSGRAPGFGRRTGLAAFLADQTALRLRSAP